MQYCPTAAALLEVKCYKMVYYKKATYNYIVFIIHSGALLVGSGIYE
jgi:hypothetical protein